MTAYVLGFAFWEEHVALIHKKRGPAPVVGRLNGIGGHVEKNESPKMAMMREFREETGLYVPADQWVKFAVLRVKAYGAIIHCYKAYLQSPIEGIKQMTDEQVGWYIVQRVPFLPVVPNLKWLVPLAQDQDKLVANIADDTYVQ